VTIEKALVVLGFFVAVAYFLVGVIGGLSLSHWEEASTSDQILWVVFLVGGAILLVAGLRISRRSPWGGFALISAALSSARFPSSGR
jgi:sulfite exporter TauE/SafE